MYFWLNYCDENHVERIPIPVKNINTAFSKQTGWLLFQNDFDEYLLSSFVEAVLSSTFYQVLFKVFW